MIDSCARARCERLLGFPAQPMDDTRSTLPVTVGCIPPAALLGSPRSRWMSAVLHPTVAGRKVVLILVVYHHPKGKTRGPRLCWGDGRRGTGGENYRPERGVAGKKVDPVGPPAGG